MRDYFTVPNVGARIAERQKRMCGLPRHATIDSTLFPLPNVWLGVSTENQETANERIPLLLQTPAAVRFVSAEPLLGPIDFTHLDADAAGSREFCQINALTGRQTDMGRPCADLPSRLDWIIVGGESGPGARGCHVSWIRSIVNQCREAKVACFVKQLGAKPLNWCRGILEADYAPGDLEPDHCDLYEASESGHCPGRCVFLEDRKGGDPDEWPEDLRVREWPD